MNMGTTQIGGAIIACYLLGMVGLAVPAGFRRCRGTKETSYGHV